MTNNCVRSTWGKFDMSTFLMYSVVSLPLVAACFLAVDKANIASGIFLLSAAGAVVLAATQPPFLITGLLYAFLAAFLAVGAILINHRLYVRVFHRAGRRRDERALQYAITVQKVADATAETTADAATAQGMRRAAEHEWDKVLAIPRWRVAGVNRANAAQKLAESVAGFTYTSGGEQIYPR